MLPLSASKPFNLVREDKNIYCHSKHFIAAAQLFFCVAHPKASCWQQRLAGELGKPFLFRGDPCSQLSPPRGAECCPGAAEGLEQNKADFQPPGREGRYYLHMAGRLGLQTTHDWYHLYPYPNHSLLPLQPTHNPQSCKSFDGQGKKFVPSL